MITPFTARYSANASGDIKFVANTLLTAPSSDASAVAARNGTGTKLNDNDFSMVYVDVDANAATFNSSQATLALPSGGSVLFAGLYWGANSTASNRAQVLFGQPGSAGYTTLNGSLIGAESTGNYQAFSDVTTLVRTAGVGTYTVANVQANIGGDRHGGWALVVVYADPTAPPRNLTVFDGLAAVNSSTPNVSFGISGFIAPPTGTVNASVGFVGYEGDLGLTGDSVKLNSTTLSDALNPAANFFNSTIGNKGARVTTKNPDYINQLGFDADIVSANGVIPNGATTATVSLTTGGETYLPGVVTTAIDLYAPVVNAVKSVVDLNGGVLEPGDVLEYTAVVQVTSGEAATKFVFLDPIPANTTYVPGSLQILSGSNSGSKTDASGDDQAEFDAVGNRIGFRLGAGATSASGGSIGVGASTSVRFRVLVSASTPDGAFISNQASTSFIGQTTGSSLTAATTVAAATVSRRSDLGLVQTVDAATPNVGDIITFSITATNNGPFANSGVQIGDLLPSGLAFVSSTPSAGTYDPASGLWTVGTLANGSSATLAVRARVISSAQATNTAAVGAADLPDPVSGNNSASVTIIPRRSDLQLISSVNDSRPNVGARVTFTTTLTNVGPDTATGVSVLNGLPAGFALVSAVPNQGTFNPVTGAWTVGTLASGASVTLTLTADVTSPDASLAAVSVASVDQFDPIAGNNVTTVPVTPTQADLAVSTGVDNPQPNVNDIITYTVRITNNGPDGATGVVAGDGGFPSGVQLISATLSQGTYDPALGRWSLGSIASGATATLVARARVTSPSISQETVSIVASDQYDPNILNNSSRTPVNPQEVALSISLQASDIRPDVGEAVTITVNLRNDGPSSASGVVVDALLPAGFAFVSAMPGRGGYDAATGVWTPGTVAAGEVVSLILVASVTSPDPALESVEISAADQFDPSTADNAAGLTFVPKQSDLYLTLDNSNEKPNVGEFVTLTLTLNNLGPDPATGVRIAGMIPPGLTLISATPSQGSLTPGSGIWDVGPVDVLTPRSLVLLVRVDSPDAKTGNAVVLSSDQYDPSASNNGLTSTLVPQQADLSLAHSVDQSSPNVGDVVTFAITLTNAGPDGATGVRVLDPLPAGFAFLSATPGQGTYDPATGAWDVGTLGGLGQQTLLIRARVDSPLAAVATASIASAAQFDPDAANNLASATVTPQQASLRIDASISDPAPNVGDLVAITVTLTNTGPDAASGVSVRDLLPAGLTFQSATPSLGVYDQATGLWTLSGVASSGSETLVLLARVDAPAAFTNSATVVRADQFDPDSGDNSTSISGTPQTVDLMVSKSVDVARPNVGDIVNLTITVSNPGPSGATGVVVRSPAGAGLTIVSSQAGAGAYDPATGIWQIGAIPTGEAVVLQIAARVNTPNALTSAASLVAFDQFDTNPANNSASVAITPQRADLGLNLSVDNPTPNVGQFVTYTLTLSNSGPDTATGVSVLDALPAGLRFVSSTASRGGYDPSTGIWSVGSVDPGSSQTLRLMVRVDSEAALVNSASVSAADQFDLNPSNNSASAASDPQQADLALTSSVSSARPNVGDTVTFTFQLSNDGPRDTTGVTVSAPLPAGLTFLSASATSGSYDPATGSWTVGAVATGTPRTLQVTARVDASAATTTSGAIVASDQFDPDAADNATSTAVIPQRADLSLTSSVNSSRPNVGDVVTFTTTLRNVGPDAATGVRVLDLLPAGLDFVSASGPGSYGPGTGVWEAGTLAAGASAVLEIRALVSDPAPRVLNAGVVASDQFDPTPVDNLSAVGVAPNQADLSLAMTVDQSAPNVGDTVTITLGVTNVGPDTATGVRILDVLPAGLGLISASPSSGLYATASGVWELGQVGPGATATLTLRAVVLASASSTNTATVLSSDQFDPVTADNAATTTVTPQQADLSLAASIDTANPNVGDVVAFTITLSNAGPDAASGVKVSDLVPVGLTFLSATPSVGSYDATSGDWQVGSVPGGDSVSLVIQARVVAAGAVANAATIAAADQFDPDRSDNSASVGLLPQSSDLSVSAIVDVATPNVGDVVSFTVTLNNAGIDPATGIAIGASLPAGYTYVSSTPATGTYDPATGLWDVGSLGASSQATLVIRARVDDAYPQRVPIAIASAAQFDPNPADNAASVGVTPQRVDLAVAVIVSDPNPNVGATIAYTVYLSNSGPETATNVRVLGVLPAGVNYVSATPSSGTYDQVTGIWDVSSVAPGEELTLVLSASVASTAQTLFPVSVLAADQFDVNSANNEAITSSAAQQSELRLSGGVDVSRPNVGDTVTLTFLLNNLGPDAATGITVSAPLPAGWNFSSATPGSGVYDPASGTWAVTSLASGSSTALILSAIVASPAASPVAAAIVQADQFDPNLGDNRAELRVTPQVADLALSEVVNTPRPNVGDVVTFTLTASNSGPDDATGVAIAAPIPAGMTFVSASPAFGSFDPATGTWLIGTLPSGTSTTLTLTAIVAAPGANAAGALVSAVDQFDSNAANNTAFASITPRAADLALTQVVDHPTPNVGDVVTFTVTLANVGPDVATSVRVADLLPAGLSLQSASPSRGTYDPATGIWALDSIAPGAPSVLTLRALVVSPAPQVVTASVAGVDQFDPVADQNTASVTIAPRQSDLAAGLAVDSTRPNVGDIITFSATITNDGPDASSGVVLLDLLPPGLTFAGTDADQGTYSPSTGIWSVGSIAPGATLTLRVRAKVESPAAQLNVLAVASADQFDPDTADNSASLTILPQSADLALSATVDRPAPNVGELITITVTLTDTGPDDASGVRVNVPLPAGLAFESASPSFGTYDATIGVWDVGSAPSATPRTLTILARVVSPNPATLVAGIASADQFDATGANNSATFAITPQRADLHLAQTTSDITPIAGQVVTFTVTLANAGPDAASGVRVLDALPSGLSFAAATPSQGSYDPATGLWDVGAVASGGTVTLVLAATVVDVNPSLNTAAIVAADQYDPSPAEQVSVAVLPQQAGVAMTHTVDNDRPYVGSTVTFTVTLTNAGPDAATGVRVLDALPSGLSFAAATASQGSYDPATGLWDVGAVASGGTVTLVLAATVVAPDPVTLTASLAALDQFDPSPLDDTASVLLEPRVNAAPVALADAYGATEDTPLVVLGPGVLANDSDADVTPLTAVLVTGPAHGTLTLNADGSFTYTPAANYNGPDSFTYQASDAALVSAPVTVALTVGAVPDAPVALPDSYTATEDTPLVVAGPGVLANDSDSDNDTLTAVLVAGPAHGTLTLNSDGSFTYTPAANYNGPDSFTYQAGDGTNLSTPVNVSLTVVAVTDSPVALPDSYTATEDTPLSIAASGVLANDSDADGSPLTAVLVSGPAHGTLALNADGSFTYTPAANYNGPDSFSYRASDGTNLSTPVTVALAVTAVPDAPLALSDSYTATEDTPLVVAGPGVLANDSDADGSPLTAVLVSGPTHGTLTLNADGSFTYTPAANYNGPDSFTYQANDSTTLSAPATVTINVTSVNDAPVALADAYGVTTGVTLVVPGPGVLANDSDPDGDPLAAVLVSGPSNGTLTLNADGSFTYTPAVAYSGPDSFTYRVSDGITLSAPVTVALTVGAANATPVAVADAYGAAEDTPLVVAGPGVLGNDSDADGDPLAAVLVSEPSNGTIVLNADGSFTYTPAANYSGPDSFTYQAGDGIALSAPVTVSLTVSAVADAPVSLPDAYAAVEDTSLVVPGPGVLANDSDLDGDPITAVLVTGPAYGTLTLNGDGSFTYTPAANYNGPDSFSYGASDGTNLSTPVTVSLTVAAVADTPVAVADNYGATEDTPLVIPGPGVLANDSDSDGGPLTAVLVAGPSNGTLILNSDGSFTYTPAANYNGPDSFIYQASDGANLSDPVTVSLIVNAAADAPVAVADAYSAVEDTPLTIAAPGVLSNDSDADGGPLTAMLVTGPAHGTLTLNADGSFTYTPAANYNGADSFIYQASDGTNLSTSVTVTLYVAAVDDAPAAGPDAYTAAEDSPLVVPGPGVLANDSDLDGDSLTAVLVTSPTHGTLILNANGTFTYLPEANYSGPDSFIYQVSDGTAFSAPATVTLSVGAINDVPVAAPDTYTATEDTPLVVAGPGVLANDSDEEGSPLTAVLASGPAHGTVVLNSDGSFTYTPASNYNGPDSFTYRASDGTDLSAPVTVRLLVGSVNDAPASTPDAYAAAPGVPLVVPDPGVLGNDSDPDGTPLTAILVAGPTHGTLALNPNGSFTYLPDPGYSGLDSFTYVASDGSATGPITTVSLTVAAAPAVAVPVPDAYSTRGSGALSVPASRGVLANDLNTAGRAFSASLVTGPAHGSLILNPDGSFLYVATPGYSGADSFTYRIFDGLQFSEPGIVILAIDASSAPRITSFARYGFHRQPTRLVLTFDSDLDSTVAENLAHYRLVSAGKDGKLGTRDDRVIPLHSAAYDPASRSVILAPRHRMRLRANYGIVVRSGGLAGRNGLPLDGDGDGQAGGDYSLRFGRSSLAGPVSLYPPGRSVPGDSSILTRGGSALPSPRLAARLQAGQRGTP